MRYPTRQFSWLLTLTTAVQELLPQNPHRKAFLLSPVPGGPGAGAAIFAQVFGPQASAVWNVPANVTQIIDMYAWGPGGNSGAAGAVLGGGGGGGGAFGTTGPLTVSPGQPFTLVVGAGGTTTHTTINNSSSTKIVDAGNGSTPVLDAAGAAGTGTSGAYKIGGGAGAAATALGGSGAGGGGAGGTYTVGAAAATTVGGAGGGSASLSGYGAGGAGGNGALTTVTGNPGTGPGGGGGGPGNNGAAAGLGAGGQIVVFYPLPAAAAGISVDRSKDVTVGTGAINFLQSVVYPFVLDDSQIGDTIWETWHVISGVNGVQMRVTEYSYDCDPSELARLVARYGERW